MARTLTSRRSERGAALLLAVVSVAILTALAVDLTYETQVRLRIAANARDELRAQALAQSAVNMSRLVLSFQRALDKTAGAVCAALPGATGGDASAAPPCPRPQLWNLVPVTSALTSALFAEGGGAHAAEGAKPEAGGRVATGTVADFQGGFDARIDDEGQKINAQLDGLTTSGVLQPQVEQLLRMMCDSKWDPLFDHTDADGQRWSRADVVVHLRDWVSDETTAAALAASFPGGNCTFTVARNPFEKAFSDKNFPYDRGSDRYRTKNSRLDSLEELHLVAGVSDAFMAAFADQLTVYLPQGAQLNVNTMDPVRQLSIAAMMADPASAPKLLDPTVRALVRKQLALAMNNGLSTITPVQFATTLEAAGVKVRADVLAQSATSPFTDKSVVFRIRAVGQAGDVSHEIDAVLSYDQRVTPQLPPGMNGPQNQPDMGTLIHWRED